MDTDVLIWYLRGNERARAVVENAIPFSISVVTYMELVQGMKSKESKDEFRVLQRHIQKWQTEILQIDENISSRAMFYVQEYALSHSMMLADALIAATVVQNSETLVTSNDKHYKFIPNISCKKFSPTA